MHGHITHDGEAAGLVVDVPACAAVRLRFGPTDAAVHLLRWVLTLAGAVVTLWAGSVLLATPASAAVVVPMAASSSLAKGGKSNGSGDSGGNNKGGNSKGGNNKKGDGEKKNSDDGREKDSKDSEDGDGEKEAKKAKTSKKPKKSEERDTDRSKKSGDSAAAGADGSETQDDDDSAQTDSARTDGISGRQVKKLVTGIVGDVLDGKADDDGDRPGRRIHAAVRTTVDEVIDDVGAVDARDTSAEKWHEFGDRVREKVEGLRSAAREGGDLRGVVDQALAA
ncbi:MAG: hypothetical protein L0H84_21455, partial [Pseudonocardia sp.]|nr:hypothetical protein [Pseudonocardia sp.]